MLAECDAMNSHKHAVRAKSRQVGLAAICLVLGTSLTSCAASTVAVADYPVVASQQTACELLIAGLPGHMLDQGRRVVTSSTSHVEKISAVWGDPTIVLRCGEENPQVPISTQAITVNGIDWSMVPRTHGYTFVSTSLAVTVSITVPDVYEPEVNVLSEISSSLPVRN